MPDRTLAERLCARYYLPVYRYVRRSVQADDEAADLTQEVFVRVVRGLHRYEPRDREAAWVFTIAHSVLATRAAREKRAPPLAPLSDAEGLEASPAVVAHASLHEALNALPLESAQVLHLREVEGLSYAEIAEATGLTVEAVRGRLARVRRQLARTVIWPSKHDRNRASEK